MGFAAAAAARSAFVVPGRLDAELKVPKRLVGFGVTMLVLGRAAAAFPGLPLVAPSTARFRGPLVLEVGLPASLGLDVTTIRLVAG